MCLLDYNKENKKYKHITYAERTMIETWYNKDKKSKKEIAALLHKSERTIRREINRGKVKIRDYEYEEKEEYSARIAQDKYEYGKTSKGPELKLDSDINLVKHIEKEIVDNLLIHPAVLPKQYLELRRSVQMPKAYAGQQEHHVTVSTALSVLFPCGCRNRQRE